MADRQELILFDLEECGARHRGSLAVRPFRANGMRAHIAFPHAHAVNNMMTKNLPSRTMNHKQRQAISAKKISILIVSVLHQDEGGIGKSIPDAREISRDPRDFPRAKPEGNLEGRGKSRGRRGWISQYLPSFGGVRTFSSSSIHLQGWIRKSIPVGREGLTVLKSILPC